MTKSMVLVFVTYLLLIVSGIVDIPGSALWALIVNPLAWKNISLIGLISDSLISIGVGVAAAGVFSGKDLLAFAGISTMLLSFGIGLMELYSIVKIQLNQTMAMLLISPLIIIYIMSVLGFWRGRET